MKYRHFYRNGGTYFFTVVTSKRSRILVSDKIFNIPVIAIYCSNARNVGFEQAVTSISTKRVCGCATYAICERHKLLNRRSVCAVRTHAFFGVQTIVSNFQTISNVVWKLLE